MLVIRLFRKGKKHQPFFKIVVTDKKRPPRGGRFTEEVGFLNPLAKQNKAKINAERVKYWISKGAQPSDTVYNLLIREKILEGKKISVHKKSKKKSEEAAAPKEEKPVEEKVEEKKEPEKEPGNETKPAE